jgi:hypothetical protein
MEYTGIPAVKFVVPSIGSTTAFSSYPLEIKPASSLIMLNGMSWSSKCLITMSSLILSTSFVGVPSDPIPTDSLIDFDSDIEDIDSIIFFPISTKDFVKSSMLRCHY